MSVRVPTTDEVDTGFTTFAWELEKSSPGEYGENSGYENYPTVCEGFRLWLAEIRREAAAEALEKAAVGIEENFQKLPRWNQVWKDGNRTREYERGSVDATCDIRDWLRKCAAEYKKAEADNG